MDIFQSVWNSLDKCMCFIGFRAKVFIFVDGNVMNFDNILVMFLSKFIIIKFFNIDVGGYFIGLTVKVTIDVFPYLAMRKGFLIDPLISLERVYNFIILCFLLGIPHPLKNQIIKRIFKIISSQHKKILSNVINEFISKPFTFILIIHINIIYIPKIMQSN